VEGQWFIRRAHYLQVSSGKEFDSSRRRGTPFAFVLGHREVIRGWEQAIATMRRGERVVFEFPPELAYGDLGIPGVIPPRARVRYDIELLDFY